MQSAVAFKPGTPAEFILPGTVRNNQADSVAAFMRVDGCRK